MSRLGFARFCPALGRGATPRINFPSVPCPRPASSSHFEMEMFRLSRKRFRAPRARSRASSICGSPRRWRGRWSLEPDDVPAATGDAIRLPLGLSSRYDGGMPRPLDIDFILAGVRDGRPAAISGPVGLARYAGLDGKTMRDIGRKNRSPRLSALWALPTIETYACSRQENLENLP